MSLRYSWTPALLIIHIIKKQVTPFLVKSVTNKLMFSHKLLFLNCNLFNINIIIYNDNASIG